VRKRTSRANEDCKPDRVEQVAHSEALHERFLELWCIRSASEVFGSAQ
jgi:hypothetical protein